MSEKDTPKETPKETQKPIRPQFPSDRIEKGEKGGRVPVIPIPKVKDK